MNEGVLAIKAILESSFASQEYFTRFWHEQDPVAPAKPTERSQEGLRDFILLQHYYNFALWHVQDASRRRDIDDSAIVEYKRRGDALNQQRSNCMEEVDACFTDLILPHVPQNATNRRNTESIGMAVDRLSILALKVFHMDEQTRRTGVRSSHIKECMESLAALQRQRSELVKAVLELVSDYATGVKVPFMYAQYKMYNDPALNPELYTQHFR